MADMLVVGGVGVDTIVRVPELPVPMVDSVVVPPMHEYVAHTGNGYARGLDALGLSVRFVDFVGDDRFGDLIRDSYRTTGITTVFLRATAGTSRAVNLVAPDGRRTSFFDPRTPEGARFPPETYRPALSEVRHAHVTIGEPTRDIPAEAVAAGVPVSTDLHDWDGENPFHRHFALSCDLVFLSAAALGDRRDTVMRRIVDEGRARLVVATDGARGSYLLDAGGGDVRHRPAIRPDRELVDLAPWRDWRAVDSNGAGDAFFSGFLRTRLAGGSPDDCLLAGAVAGAFACRSAGTHTEFIDAATLDTACAALG